MTTQELSAAITSDLAIIDKRLDALIAERNELREALSELLEVAIPVRNPNSRTYKAIKAAEKALGL